LAKQQEGLIVRHGATLISVDAYGKEVEKNDRKARQKNFFYIFSQALRLKCRIIAKA